MIVLQYDPYRQSATFKYKSEENGIISDIKHLKKEQENALNMLEHDIILQNQIENLINVLKQINGNQDVNYEFIGTQKDYKDFEESIKNFAPNSNTRKNDKNFYKEPEEIREYIQKACSNIRKEIDALNRKYPDYKDALLFNSSEIDETLNDRTPIVFLGSGSTGKSSVINALIGAEVLPTADGTTTETIYEITPADYFEISLYCDSKENKIRLTSKTAGEEFIKDILGSDVRFETDDPYDWEYQTIASINEVVKNNEKNISEIGIKVPFKNLRNISNKIVIYDTPGPDSKTRENHKDILNKALTRFKKGIAIFVANPTDIEKINLRGFLKNNIKNYESISQILNINASIILINAADKSNQMKIKDAKESRNKHLREMLNESERQMFLREQDRLIYFSSVYALSVHKNNESKWWDSKFEEMICCDGTKKVDNPDEKFYLPLATLAELPAIRKTEIFNAYKDVESNYRKNNSETNRKELIAYNSGLRVLEYELGFVVNELSICNLCAQAQKQLQQMLKNVNKSIDNISDSLKKNENEFQERMDKKYCAIVESLFGNTENSVLSKAKQSVQKDAAKSIGSEASLIDSIINEINNNIDNNWKIVKKNPEEYIENQIIEKIKNIVDQRNVKSQKWYEEKFEEFKSDCRTIVFENKNLDDSERRALEKCLKGWVAVEFDRKISIDKNEIISRFLLVFSKLDKSKCKEAAESHTTEILSKQKDEIRLYLINQFDKSCENARTSFFTEDKIKSANPELEYLITEIKNLDIQCKDYIKLREKVNETLATIDNLTKLQAKG